MSEQSDMPILITLMHAYRRPVALCRQIMSPLPPKIVTHHHMTEHSPSFCFPILLLEMRSRSPERPAFLPSRLSSSSRPLALG